MRKALPFTGVPPAGGLGPGPGDPATFRRAWIAGRVGLAFDEGDPPAGGGGTTIAPSCADRPVERLSLPELLELDVDERPYVWDLPEVCT